MATGTHTWTDTSETTSGTTSQVIRSWDLYSAYSSNIRNAIPFCSRINKVILSLDGKQNLSLSNGSIEIYLASQENKVTENAARVYYEKDGVTKNYKTFSADVTSYFTLWSETSMAGLAGNIINGSYAYAINYIVADCHATVIRKFSLKNASLYYEFTYPTFTIKVSAEGQGDVSGGGTWDVKKTTQTKTITATPKTGYKFLHWVDNQGNTYKDATTEISFYDNSLLIKGFSTVLECVAVFDPISYTITANKIGGGYVSGAGKHSYGKTATLTAVPEEGYRFVEWIEDRSTENPRSFTVTGDATYTAYFEKITYTATFKNYDGTVLQTVQVQHGSAPSYTGSTPTKPADTQYIYTFSGWSPSIGTITSNTTYTAQFTATKRKYTINTSATNGIVSGGGAYEYGSPITLIASPADGYKFEKWSDGNTQNPRDITVTGDATYEAQFRRLVLKFKTVKIYYPSENDIASPTNPLVSGEKAQMVVQVALE